VLERLDFEVRTGSVFALLGSNGATGKTHDCNISQNVRKDKELVRRFIEEAGEGFESFS